MTTVVDLQTFCQKWLTETSVAPDEIPKCLAEHHTRLETMARAMGGVLGQDYFTVTLEEFESDLVTVIARDDWGPEQTKKYLSAVSNEAKSSCFDKLTAGQDPAKWEQSSKKVKYCGQPRELQQQSTNEIDSVNGVIGRLSHE